MSATSGTFIVGSARVHGARGRARRGRRRRSSRPARHLRARLHRLRAARPAGRRSLGADGHERPARSTCSRIAAPPSAHRRADLPRLTTTCILRALAKDPQRALRRRSEAFRRALLAEHRGDARAGAHPHRGRRSDDWRTHHRVVAPRALPARAVIDQVGDGEPRSTAFESNPTRSSSSTSRCRRWTARSSRSSSAR